MRCLSHTLAGQDEARGDLLGFQHLVPQHSHLTLCDPGDAGPALPSGAEEGGPQSLPAKARQNGLSVTQLDMVGPAAEGDGGSGGGATQRR